MTTEAQSRSRPSLFSGALLISVIIGLLLGYAFPNVAQAANFWEEWFDIPAGGTTGQTVTLTCGWHSTCDPNYPDGPALDWASGVGDGVYFAGAAKWSGTYVTDAAWVNPQQEDEYGGSFCKNVVATVLNWYTFQYLSAEVYEHVDVDPVVAFPVYAYSSPWPVRMRIATVALNDLSNCPRHGPHIHNYAQDVSATDRSCNQDDCIPYPLGSVCNIDYGCTPPFQNNTWVTYKSWYY